MRRQNSIDPLTALPITYKTLSFKIQGTKEKARIEAVRAKEDTAAELGDLDLHTISINELQNRLSTSLVQDLSKEQLATKAKEFGKKHAIKTTERLVISGFWIPVWRIWIDTSHRRYLGHNNLQTSRRAKSRPG
jgi:sodium/potassium-transporting ATPase subunit alpha